MMGDHEGGVRHCLDAISLQPDYVVAIIKTIRGYQELGRFAEARAMIVQGLQVDPDNAFLQQLRDRLWRARIRHGLGRLKAGVCRLIGR